MNKTNLLTKLLLLCLCVVGSANVSWADTFNVEGPTSNSYSKDGVTIAGTKANLSFTSSGKKDCFTLNSASSVWIYSLRTNITGVSFDIVRNTNGSSKSGAVTMTVATGGAYSTPSSGFTATNDGNNIASLTGITAIGNNQTSATAISVSFSSAVKTIVLTQTASCSVRNITVTYDNSVASPSTYFAAHISDTNTATIDTNPGGASTTVATSGNSTVGEETWYKLNSAGVTIDLGEGHAFEVGDQIAIDIAGSGTNKTNKGTNICKSDGTSIAELKTGALTNAVGFKHFYIVKADDGIEGQQSMKITSGSTDCRYYSYSVLRTAAVSGDAINLDKTIGTTNGSGTIAANATSFTPTAPTYAGHTVDRYYATYSDGAYSNYIANAAGELQPDVTVDTTPWTNGSSQWVKGGDAIFYTKWKVNDPTVSCENNTVTIAAAEDATIYYTTDGVTEPTSESNPYSEPFAIAATTTVKAIAIQSGCTSSGVVSQECEYVVPKVATPTISPADGSTYSGASQTITLSCDTDGATIYYTVDGSTPTSSSNEYDPEDKPSISSTTTIKAIAIKADWTDSEVATATIKKVTSSTWGSWDFTNWSSTTQAGVRADDTNWRDYETSTTDKPLDDKCYFNKEANSTFVYGSTTIPETEGLSFATTAYTFGLAFDLGSTNIGTYHGSQYLWLYGKSSVITISAVPAGATIEIGFESHNGTDERTLNVTNTSENSSSTTSYTEQTFTVSSTGNVTISPSKGMHIYYITVTTNVETVPATIAASGWTSLASNKALNYAGAEEQESVALKAYAISSISKTSVTLTPHDAAPDNVGMILKGNPYSTYNIPVATSASSFYNELSAAVTATPVEARSVYAVSEGKLKLFTGTTVPAGKAYLLASKVDPEARGLSLNFDEDGETTGIAEINSKKGLLDGDFYDLSGRKVAQPTKGLYIMNGRKVIVK